MIKPEDRFWVESIQVFGDTTTTSVIDWDQRRIIAVSGPSSLFPDGQDFEIAILKRYIDQISPCVRKITVDEKGLLVSISSDPEDDATYTINYPNLLDVPSLKDCPTVELSKLVESNRLGPTVDLMRYVDESGSEKNVVFKYNIIFQQIRKIWNELNIVKALPSHPNLVPFDSVVVDDTHIIGFTTRYITGGTLDDKKGGLFRLEWLRQLTSVLDYLNLELGIMHQDIAPRNLIVDEENNLRVFDFDRAAYVNQPGICDERNDVTGVVFTLYEIVTLDDHFRKEDFTQQDPNKVLDLEDWPVRCLLDEDLALFRQHLTEWVRMRRGMQAVVGIERPCCVPDMPARRPLIIDISEAGEPVYRDFPTLRRVDALKFGEHVVSWERPPSCKVTPFGPGEEG